jgi:hypothetical protein
MNRQQRPVTVGQRFGRGSVLVPDAGRSNSFVMVGLICDCGTVYITRRKDLWAGQTLSCGCRRCRPDNRGQRHGKAKLTDDDIRRIRSNPGRLPQTALAAEFGVGQSRISDIVNKRAWRHVA